MDQAADFTQGNILSKMLKFMLPILGALVLQAMYGAVDVLVVGHFGTTAGISGVSTGSSVINLVIFSVTSLAMGVTVLMGQYIGEGRADKVGRVVGGSICFFLVLAVVIAILLLVFARPFAMLMQAPEEALELTVTYIRICGGGIFFIIAYNLISSIFRGMGNSRLPLIFVAIACAANILGDLLFIAVLHMNVAGAALATVMAQAISVILSLLIISRQKLPFSFHRNDIAFNAEIGKFVRIGIPIALQEVLTQFSFLALCSFINALGLAASSGYGVANRLVGFIMLLPNSLMQCLAAFVAQNVGAGKESRSRRALLTGIILGSCVGFLIALLTYFQGSFFSSIFTSDPVVIASSADYLRGFALEAMITCISFSFIGYFNGHGQTMYVMIQGLSQTFLIRLPMSYLMSIQPNATLHNIGLAAPSATLFAIILHLIYFLIYSRRRKMKALTG